jgi:hypothetical protein
MSRIRSLRALAALLLFIGVAGCRDELPTAVGPGPFPAGTLLTSFVVDLPAAEYLELVGQFSGYTGVRDAPYLLVAHRFDGELEARTLKRLIDFPEAVSYTAAGTTVTDSVFVYTTGQLVAAVDTGAVAAPDGVTLRLHALTQEWDRSATWAFAVDTAGVQVPWTQPGGALGAELARTTWIRGDTLLGDTVRWEVDSLAVAQMAAEGFPGVAVVAEGQPARIQLGEISLRTGARPASRPDTAIAVTVAGGPDTFIFSPELPGPNGSWLIGGLASARTLFRLTLPDSLRACPPGTPEGAACPRHALRDVTLNEVSLRLEPVPVEGGFRPLRTKVVRVRSVSEPELGRRAPLGPPVLGRVPPGFTPLFAEVQLTPDLFVAPADTALNLVLTEHLRGLVARDTTEARVNAAFALVGEPEGVHFGHARFRAAPQLRIVYTLPAPRRTP